MYLETVDLENPKNIKFRRSRDSFVPKILFARTQQEMLEIVDHRSETSLPILDGRCSFGVHEISEGFCLAVDPRAGTA